MFYITVKRALISIVVDIWFPNKHSGLVLYTFCLQSMLPWVTTALSEDEQNIMMDTLRQATRNTMFDKWLRAWWKNNPASCSDTAEASEKHLVPPVGTTESLQMVVDYLSKGVVSTEDSIVDEKLQTVEASIHENIIDSGMGHSLFYFIYWLGFGD